MNKNKKNVPKIRFNDFDGAWERRGLKEVADYRNGKAHEQDINQDGKYIVVNSKFISSDGKVKKFSNILLEPLKRNELTFVLSDVPKGKALAKSFLIDKDNKYTLNQRIAGITPYENTNSYFLNVLMNRNIYFLKFDNGVGQTNLSKQDVEEFQAYYPKYEEQRKIGLLFAELEHNISLRRRELELLKTLKKTYLQKLFPKDGADKPEIRFNGFDADWERRKLSDGTSKIGDGLHGTPNYTETGSVYFINGNNLMNGEIVITEETKIVTFSEQSKNDKELNSNTLLMSINGTIGNLAFYNGEKIMLGKSVAFINVSTFDRNFIYTYLQTNKVRGYFMNSLTGTTIKNLGLKAIREAQLLVPKIQEQQKIGLFFSKLDNLINSQQRKVNLLKDLKKAFLQKMFI